MKLILIVVPFISLTIIGCDPTHRYILYSAKTEIIVEMYPSLESRVCPSIPEQCEIANSKRIAVRNNGAVYKINKGEQFVIFGGVGAYSTPATFPYDSIRVTAEGVSIKTSSTNEILKYFKREKYNDFYFQFDSSLIGE